MIVLAIDTAGVDCAAALYDSDKDCLLAEVSETIGRGHAEKLMAMIDQVLDAAHLPMQAVERVGVTIGPGSFTGIRVGLAAARGLALGLDVEIVGVSTLQVMAAAYRQTAGAKSVLSAIDAKRGEVYAQAFDDDGVPIGEPQLLKADFAADLVRQEGLAVTGSAASLLLSGEPDERPDHFPIEIVARLAAEAPVGDKPKPLYLRGPDAKPQTGFAVARM
ncbi:tRNA (adenosine(37)-N6)-threonylcarbamoyltransferase complex dimerization subunit type 1 TsaB [Agrobacterium sp. a22-2]|uniref:tRNA (adenosine(37)-N6)-threonylcarbamoyltransferase complex dimerization subunit type 1 TsaB n=1 Tax=Agrobacterium sp. a22-2 TaxID=2283840 RepID=UPI0014481B44|nr:tRNA (adenosine(37)-N6)-threonylcarbamoyltransferase complex dimerization subunit type 1 TsaB [Agrobacterium sp. a22-2]NKN35078.1 tRNA (adenosine(37)-N6)-threonylcarbamoyltransferase complex dimerization subunit type 1 TsaB [Agrobacterium sp. a22-2]